MHNFGAVLTYEILYLLDFLSRLGSVPGRLFCVLLVPRLERSGLDTYRTE